MILVETNHPLQQTFTRISQLSPYLCARLGRSSETGWITPADLFAPQSAALAVLLNAARQRLHTQAATLIGSALIQEYQWPLISTGIACFLTDRRVPDLRPENLSLRFPPEEEETEEVEHPDRIAFTTGRFAALPDDPAAGHPDAYLVPDLDALRAELRSGLEAHMAWAIAQISRVVGCKDKGLWLFVADRCAMTLSWLMQEQEGQSCFTCISREAKALVQAPDSPLYHKRLNFFELSYKERTRIYPDRTTCCYWYKTEGGDYCTTCPHRSQEDRNERLLKYLAEEYAQATA